jgi:hypothetical protein
MRYRFLILIGTSLLGGCLSSHKPYDDNPLLLHYRPTLSDSETVLAEAGTRRGPTQPPMPALVAEAPKDHAAAPFALTPAATEPIVPAQSAVAPGDLRPIIRQSSESSQPLLKTPDLSPALNSELKPVIVSPPSQTNAVTVIPEIAGVEKAKPADTVADKPNPLAANGEKRKVTGQFGHDAEYHWLQGVVEKYRGLCFIRYCDPSTDDEYGGKFLVQDPKLAPYQDGDVIGVEGELDKTTVGDKSQKPKYVIRDAWLVKAK